MPSTPAQANCLRAFSEALADAGIAGAVLSPGSRSAPLILALGTTEGITSHSVIDERTAGFFALGLGKAAQRPAAVACTSGTAAANLAPSVHEAREAKTPLLVLTADRPPELRAAGDNQTIDQIGVFGSAAKQLSPPSFSEDSIALWTQFASECVEATLHPFPGPVHVNVPLWDPLAALPDEPATGTSIEATPNFSPNEEKVDLPGGCTVVIAGRDEFGTDDELVGAADALGIPVLPDPLSPASTSGSACVIAHWDSILRVEEWAAQHRPDVIVRTGDLPTSKPLRAWIKHCAEAGTEVIHFDPLNGGRDPDGINTAHLTGSLTTSLRESARGDASWLADWVQADAKAAAALEANRADQSELTEPDLIHCITNTMGSDETLFVAASMPIRDVESFGDLEGGPRTVANRGANGIDGTIATAAGFATQSGQPLVLTLGDVTFAHDVASLAVLREVRTPILVVVINNGGGAIFDNLPISERGDVYERFVFTPPRLNISHACAAWGIKHSSVESLKDIESLWSEVKADGSARVAEVVVRREASPLRRSSLRAAVSQALTSA